MITLNKSFFLKLTAVIAVLLIAGGILAYPAYQLARKWGLDVLLNQYEQFAEEGEAEPAFQKAYRAYQLFPDSEGASLALARASLEVNHPDAPQFWEPVLDYEERSPEDLKAYVQYLLETFQFERAFRLTPRLFREMPDDPEVHEYHIQGLIRNRKFAQIVGVARELIDRGFETPFIYENLYVALWAVDTENSRNAALSVLYENASRQDEIGAGAARRLLSFGFIKPEIQRELAHWLVENPEAPKEDLLVGIARLETLGELNPTEKESLISERFNLEQTDDLSILANWYFENGSYEKVIDLAPPEKFMAEATTSRIYHQSLIQLGRAREAYENTLRTDRDPGLETVDILLIRAQAQEILGQQEEFEQSLNLAVEQVSLNEFSDLERTLFEVEAWQVADRLYRRILEVDGLELIGRQKLIWSKYLQGDEYRLLRYLREIDLRNYEEEPPVLAFLAYLKLLFQQDPVETRFALEELVSDYPSVTDFRLVQAFALLQDRQTEEAWSLIQDQVEPILRNGLRFHRIILLATASASDYEGDLQQLRDYLDTEPMLASEIRLLRRTDPLPATPPSTL